MIARRLRMIAGPNGSGKSTLFEVLQQRGGFPLGYCLNPDLLLAELRRNGQIDFTQWGLNIDEQALHDFVAKHGLREMVELGGIKVVRNILSAPAESAGGYFMAVLSDLMRRRWLAARESFTFESVMSGGDKIELIREAQQSGYRTYLYFICTDSAAINQDRVANRVSQGGHDVPQDKIFSRYQRSLKLLPDAIRACSRAYLFDNSRSEHEMIAEFESGRIVSLSGSPPKWFIVSVASQPDLIDPDV